MPKKGAPKRRLDDFRALWITLAAMSDLRALERRHENEESRELSRTLVEDRRPMKPIRPSGGSVPKSQEWLDRFYEGERAPREKKPGVFDHLRSNGPWFVSIDEEPLSVIDGMSQTATVCGGFAEDPVVRAYVEGHFGDTLLKAYDTAIPSPDCADLNWAANDFADTLRRLVPGLPHVSFVNSGAESCEKAFALCRLQAKSKKQKRVLCFEGSFHGRTLLSLHASYNPLKRGPFEMKGYEVSFAPFPVWWEPEKAEPEAPDGFLKAAASDPDSLRDFQSEFDCLLNEEISSLLAVHEHLASGEYFVTAVEPMQSEGGDRYATARYFKALRLLTRHHGVPLVFDEVQSGFGLGGTFAWHSRFGLVDENGNPDTPDCVTFAKRAQVGVVMSVFEDPEPTSTSTASLIRGKLHAEWMANDEQWREVQEYVRMRLSELAGRFPELVKRPRATGYAVAFDAPSKEHQLRFIKQRFWRGCVVFGAGVKTIRYRLSKAFTRKEIDLVFDGIIGSLKWLEANPGEDPPKWQDTAIFERPRKDVVETRVRSLEASDERELLPQIVALEERVYEPARQDPPEKLAKAFRDPAGVAIVAEAKVDGAWSVVGVSLGVPLERVATVEGPDRDPMLGRKNTLYSLAITIDPRFRGYGLGVTLKQEQIRAAGRLRTLDGGRRYRHISGRNRVGDTAQMMRINRMFGAYEVFTLDNQYGEDAQALYYRLPVGEFGHSHAPASGKPAPIDLASGLSQPFDSAPASLRALNVSGGLYGPVVNKLTIVNYVTPAIVRAAEWLTALTPNHPHLFLTSSRDECFDKSLRAFRYHRPKAQIAIGLSRGYLGHTSAAARSVTCSKVHRAGPAYFDRFCRVKHPSDGEDHTIKQLEAIIKEHGADAILGFFFEAVQERSGKTLSASFLSRLDALRAKHGIPVALTETASACYRSGRGAFYSSEGDFVPDILTWWSGGQAGFIHCQKDSFVKKPLTMVSTWDGDELSMIRAHHQLRAARHLDVAALSDALDDALKKAPRGMKSEGIGAYRVLHAGKRAEAIHAGLLERGFFTRRYANDTLGIAPPLDLSLDRVDGLGKALSEL